MTMQELRQFNELFSFSDELDKLLAAPWLVWSNYHNAWWGPNRSGYYIDMESVGRYTLEEAMTLCRARSQAGDGSKTEMIQPSPELLQLWIEYGDHAGASHAQERRHAIPWQPG